MTRASRPGGTAGRGTRRAPAGALPSPAAPVGTATHISSTGAPRAPGHLRRRPRYLAQVHPTGNTPTDPVPRCFRPHPRRPRPQSGRIRVRPDRRSQSRPQRPPQIPATIRCRGGPRLRRTADALRPTRGWLCSRERTDSECSALRETVDRLTGIELHVAVRSPPRRGQAGQLPSECQCLTQPSKLASASGTGLAPTSDAIQTSPRRGPAVTRSQNDGPSSAPRMTDP